MRKMVSIMQNSRQRRPWVGPWLRKVREAADKPPSLDDVARKVRKSKAAISRFETGKAAISADDLPAFLRAYGVDLGAFDRASP